MRDEDLGLACPNNMSSSASAGPRTWFITGCSSGFGRAIAEAALQAGDRVVLTARDVSSIESLAAVVPEQALALALDVTNEDQIHAALDAAVERFGPLDVVVNNAGWTHRNKPYLEVTEAEFDKVYAINVKSVYLSALHAVPVFRKQGGGCFVNIASTAGLRPRPGLTKWAVVAARRRTKISPSLWISCENLHSSAANNNN